MIPFIMALFWALVCPNYTNSNNCNNGSQVTTLDDDGGNGDTGGETGHPPTKPPTPPPHP